MSDWLTVWRGAAPLIVSIPHAGSALPRELMPRLQSDWRATKDTDWHIDQVYAFARDLGATVIETKLSRSFVDVNRDPSGRSLYPGLVTTGLCPLETFDGEPLYGAGLEPDATEIAARSEQALAPYHQSIAEEILRLRRHHPQIVLYDAHSIRSHVPRLFDGALPELNIGSDGDRACAPALTQRIAGICEASRFSWVANGRFRGGYITRHFGKPDHGVHAVQMEIAHRAYLDEPDQITPDNWPPRFDAKRAAPLIATVRDILETCIAFAEEGP